MWLLNQVQMSYQRNSLLTTQIKSWFNWKAWNTYQAEVKLLCLSVIKWEHIWRLSQLSANVLWQLHSSVCLSHIVRSLRLRWPCICTIDLVCDIYLRNTEPVHEQWMFPLESRITGATDLHDHSERLRVTYLDPHHELIRAKQTVNMNGSS